MPRKSMIEAVRDAIDVMMERDDNVVVFGEDTPLETIRALEPDVLVKGAEYESGTIVGATYVEEHGGRVERVPMLKGFSTTALIEKMRR